MRALSQTARGSSLAPTPTEQLPPPTELAEMPLATQGMKPAYEYLVCSTPRARAVSSSYKSITNGSFSDVTRRGTRSASTVFEARRELLAVHAAPEAACTASEAARLAEALEQESVPREVTSMCQPTQSIS